jgi:hypothetical protein
MRTQSQTRSFFDVERSALRLSDQFRRDVHRASAAMVEDASHGEGTFLQLQHPDGHVVEYRRLEGSVLRILSQDGHAVSRDEFPFSSAIELALREEDAPRRFILSITSEPDETPTGNNKQPVSIREMPFSFQAEAVLSRDWRFMAAIAHQENAK